MRLALVGVPVGLDPAAALLVAGSGGRVPAWQGHPATPVGDRSEVVSGGGGGGGSGRRLQGLLPVHGSAAFSGADLR